MKKTIYENRQRSEEKAILFSLIVSSGTLRTADDPHHSLEELIRLAETAGVVVADAMQQKKEAPDPGWFIGKGKVDEIKQRLLETDATTVIFDQELSGMQVRNLEAALDAKIIDRTQLILDIFAGRAKTREGILQVELAQLSYLLPRLSGHGKNLSRLGGGIGTRGPGETQLETDRRHIRNRIHDLKVQLKEVARHRKLIRDRRAKAGVFQVALVGYTNAGKSTLLQQLTNTEEVYVENQLFATLDPLSRTLTLPGGQEIVLTDTVGFIQNLPHDVVSAFRATLEEVNDADLILHVVDSSSDRKMEQMQVVDRVLAELGAHTKDQLILYNKIDLCPADETDMLPRRGDALLISAYAAADLEKVKSAIEQRMSGDRKTFQIPADKGDVIASAYQLGKVLEQRVVDDTIMLQVRVDRRHYQVHGGTLSIYEKH